MGQPVISRDEVQRLYDRLGTRLDWNHRFESAAKRRTMDLLQLAPGQRVLNVGVGTGKDHVQLRRAVQVGGMAIGVDISPVMLRLAASRGAYAVRADARRLPFPDQSFDRLWSTYVLDLIPDDDLPGVLAEFRRVLKPGGRVALASRTEGVTLTSRMLMGIWKRVYHMAPKLTVGCRPLDLSKLVASAGLQVIERAVIMQRALPTEVLAAVRQ